LVAKLRLGFARRDLNCEGAIDAFDIELVAKPLVAKPLVGP
jgi:hypothetical protein